MGDFFGSGVGVYSYQDWNRRVESDGTMTSRWVMPFRKNCTIELQNLGRQQRGMDTADRTDWNYLTATGEGVFVADPLALLNRVVRWWGEGDEKIYVDGETLPSHFGTGTEDYYGYGWCEPSFYEAPFHAQPRAEGPRNFGHVTNTRVRLLDANPFRKSFVFDLEIVPRRWLVTGGAFGLAILVKSVFGVMFLGLLVVLFWRHRRRPAVLARLVVMLVLGSSLALTPLVARNLAVGAPALALSSVNSTAFAMSNGAQYDPGLNKIDLKEIAGIMGRTDGRFLPTVVETLRTHTDPLGYAGFVWRKFRVTWHGFEMPNNASFYYHRLFSRTLRLLPVTFFILSPLALVGLFLGLPRFRTAWPLYLLTGTHLLVMLIALDQSRYRIPLLAALLLFSAWTIVRCLDWLRTRRWKRIAVLTVVVVLLGLWTARALPPNVKAVREGDCTALLRWHLKENGRPAARQYLLTVLGVVPESIGARLSLGDVERHEFNCVEAARHYEQALELDPRNRYGLGQLAKVYERIGRPAQAEEVRQRLRETD